MFIEITGAKIIGTEHGPDVIFFETLLPEPAYPFEGTASLKLTCAKGMAKVYLEKLGVDITENVQHIENMQAVT